MPEHKLSQSQARAKKVEVRVYEKELINIKPAFP